MNRGIAVGTLALCWSSWMPAAIAQEGQADRGSARVVYRIEPYENGKAFGTVGPYVRIAGTFYGEVDPADAHSSLIVDIDKAPVNARGRVEYQAQFIVLRPSDATNANGTLVHTVPNRGNLGQVDEFRLENGYILSWVAWQGDVLPGNNRLLMKVPIATEKGQPIINRIRTEYTVEDDGIYSVALGSGAYTKDSHDSYEAASTDTRRATLTVREYEKDPRVTVAPSDWAFANCPNGVRQSTAGDAEGQTGGLATSSRHLCVPAGFKRGWIYELIYQARDPKVMGLGFASTRDFLSFLRFEASDAGGNANPLFSGGRSLIRRVIMTGASQTGRYCRQFLHLGFHLDGRDRPVIEGLWPHITTARLPLNMQFAAPGRGFVQHEEHSFPSYEFPVAYNVMKDAFSSRVDGVLRKCGQTNTCPKIFHSVSGSEYWQERASLNTTDALGQQDLELPANVRFFYLSSTQHGPAASALKDPRAKNRSNPAPHLDSMRALLVALNSWMATDTPPPPSMYPRLADGTLVEPDIRNIGFPAIPGVTYTGTMNELPLYDYGPDFLTKGIITNHPPTIVPGKAWRPLVPKVDADGNDVAGFRSVAIMAPIGTYTGWNLRSREAGAENELYDLQGSFIPFARTRAERLAAGDPRLSLEERYGNHDGYVAKVRAAAGELVSMRLLLKGDAERIVRNAETSEVLK